MLPYDVVPAGSALESQGLVGLGFAFDSIGLLTQGLVWPCNSIWSPADPVIVTAWLPVTSGSVEDCTGIE